MINNINGNDTNNHAAQHKTGDNTGTPIRWEIGNHYNNKTNAVNNMTGVHTLFALLAKDHNNKHIQP